ncbi:collagenase [Pseudoalteromonas fenneropenaei]|uniref:microbial collagenase n=1 Tax=Pseudoalteromonas fenneropenaei TaxID=1737459 RepID=A0ABV7CHV0_9GAMM
MKLTTLITSMPILGASLVTSINALAAAQHETRHFTPIPAVQTQTQYHAHDHKQADERAPIAVQVKQNNLLHKAARTTLQAAATNCDLSALANANSNTIADLVVSQGAGCINDLFSAASAQQAQVFTAQKMLAAADRAQSLATAYAGNGSDGLEALFLFIRAGFYVEFYNDSVTFPATVKPAVKAALDAFVNNSHFYDDNDAHGKVLSEAIITMDSSEQQDVYLPVVKQWLSRWNQSYAGKWNMRGAVNNIFTILYRGQWNSNFVALVGNDQDLVTQLDAFVQKTWMVNSDAEFMIANAGSELARLKKYSGTAIQTKVDSALNALFSRYQSYGFGDAVWLAAADVASYYVDCSKYNICNFDKTLESQVLAQSHQCSNTIRIRAQELTSIQLTSACATMAAEETRFHASLATNNQPVANDNNTFLQVNIFNSSADYQKYAKAIFKIDTNNGGMYLEGDPSKVGNQANFIAYEASYAKPDHFIWNLEHEYVHYLDGRFDMYGDFNAPTQDVVWWSEGVAEYIANQNDNQAAIDTIKDGSVYNLAQIFATTYDGFDVDRIYRWGYLAVRFMFERHFSEVEAMLAQTRVGNWSGYKSTVDSWAQQYNSEFSAWTQELANGTSNQAPTAVINGPYSGDVNSAIAFSSAGSADADGSIVSYVWDFGDGSQSNQASPSHSYTSAGSYTVTLTVTDNQGLATQASTNVTVNAVNTGTTLQKGVAVTLAAAQNEQLAFTFTVPAGASDLSFVTSGGSGDGDLYVRFGAAPTTTSWDCRPYVGGNAERCDIATPQAGTYHVMVRGYNAFSGLQLVADYTAAVASLPNACQTQGPVTSGRLTAGQATCLGGQDPMWFSLENVSGQQSISIETAHGTGDLNLEYSNQGWPTASNVEASSNRSGNGECINLSGQNNYWGYLKVSGQASGATIKVSYNEGWCN